MNLYSVQDRQFSSYFEAIEYASSIKSRVILIATGQVKWEPLPEVSKKKVRQYRDRLNAYNAYKSQGK